MTPRGKVPTGLAVVGLNGTLMHAYSRRFVKPCAMSVMTK